MSKESREPPLIKLIFFFVFAVALFISVASVVHAEEPEDISLEPLKFQTEYLWGAQKLEQKPLRVIRGFRLGEKWTFGKINGEGGVSFIKDIDTKSELRINSDSDKILEIRRDL